MSLSVHLWRVEISEKTTWLFVSVTDKTGITGFGEATANHHIAEIIRSFPKAIEAASNCPLGLGAKLGAITGKYAGKVGNAIASAIEQAVLDMRAQHQKIPLFAGLGGHYRTKIPAYANINRGTLDRTPDGFAARAKSVVTTGYKAIKFAPFDGVEPTGLDSGDNRQLFKEGVARIAAVAEILKGSARIQIDCHARFTPADAAELMEKMGELDVGWLEEPIAETDENLAQIADMRTQFAKSGRRFAGAEQSESLAQFSHFLNHDCYDVVMPDIILAGGLSEVMAVGRYASQRHIAVSPHNPCGPIMDVMSAHVAAALPLIEAMERQVAESPLYDEIITTNHHFEDGIYRLSNCEGSGAKLNLDHPAIQNMGDFTLQF